MRHARHPAGPITDGDRGSSSRVRRWPRCSPANYGIYNGFELIEHAPIPGREEFIDSEKYEIRPATGTSPATSKPTSARSTHPQRKRRAATDRQPALPDVDDDGVIGFLKESADGSNAVAGAIAMTAGRTILAAFRRRADRPRAAAGAGDREPRHRRAPSAGMGRRAAAPRSRARSRAAVPLSSRRARHEHRARHIQANRKPPTTGSGSRTPSSTSCTSRHLPDLNGDGIGDFAGLTERLDYLRDLGVTALWLLPFYPSPGRDDGYDISDYGDINRDFGTHARLSPLHAGSQAPRAARHHRIGRQPHLRPASLVQARQAQPGRIERARLVRLERQRPEISPAPASSSPTPKSPTGPGTRRPAPITGTASSRTSRISTSTIRAW